MKHIKLFENFKEDIDVVGKEMWFEYHCFESPDSADAELWYRSHQKVKVLSRGIDDHDEFPEEPKVYNIEFSDGFKGTAYDDELCYDPSEFYRPDPPKNMVKESVSKDDKNKLINDIKKMLIMQNMIDMDDFNEQYHGDWNKAWIDFVDNQVMGDCQNIAYFIHQDFPQIQNIVGEIEVDEPYIDEYDEEQIHMIHHWVNIFGKIYDFSKGTLKDYIDWTDLYEVEIDEDEWRYQ